MDPGITSSSSWDLTKRRLIVTNISVHPSSHIKGLVFLTAEDGADCLFRNVGS